MTIRIKNDPKHAIISVSEEIEPSDEVKLRLIAWLVSGVARKLGVREIELAYESDEQP